jgi:predicted secreted protein with PEFG-CTERM motif
LLAVVYLQLVLVFAAVSSAGQNVFAQTTITLDAATCTLTFLEGKWISGYNECTLEGPIKIPRDVTLLVDEGSSLINKGTLENIGKLENRGRFNNNGIFLNFGDVLNEAGEVNNYGVIKNEGNIHNRGSLFNYGGFVNNYKIENNIRLLNYGILINYDAIDNKGQFDNGEIYYDKTGTLINGKSGVINNLGSGDKLVRVGNYAKFTTFINEGVITFTSSSVFENFSGDVSNSGRIKVDVGGTFNNQGPFQNTGTILNDSDRFYHHGATLSNTGSISSTGTLQNGGVINNSCNGSVSGKVEGNEPVDLPTPCGPAGQGTTSIELNKDSCSLDPFNGQFDSNAGICTVEGFTVGSNVSITIASGVELYNTGNVKAVNTGMINLHGTVRTAGPFDNAGTIIIDGDGMLQTSFVEGSAVPFGGAIRNFGNIEITSGVLQNTEQGSFYNIGTIVNHAMLINSNIFENLGSGIVWSEGTLANTGNLTSSGKIKNCGPAISGIGGTASIEQDCMSAGSRSVNYAISSGDLEFSVATALTNGIVIDVVPDPAANRLILTMATSPSTQGELTIALPRSVIDAKNDDSSDQRFFILIDNGEADYEETETSDSERVLKIAMPNDAYKIDIIGTHVVPEFPISLLVLAATIGSIIVLTARRQILPSRRD